MSRSYENEFLARVPELDDEALLRVLANPGDHTADAVAAVEREVARRGGAARLKERETARTASEAAAGADVEAPRPSASLSVAALFAGLTAAGLVYWALGTSDLYPAGRKAAMAAVVLALGGLVTALFGARKTQRLRGLAFLAGLLNLGVLPFSLGLGSMVPQTRSFLPRALREVREVLAAQASYREANHGFYDSRLDCLVRPAECIPGYPADGPGFLAKDSLSTPRSWYTFSFRPGPAPSSLPEGASPTSVVSYSYACAPADPSSYVKWAVCGDSTGLVCVTEGNAMPDVAPDGTCVIEQCSPERSGWHTN